VAVDPLGLKTMFRTMPVKFIVCPLMLIKAGALKSVEISSSRPTSITHRLDTISGT
jgi:hypothetical protein